MAIDPTEKLLEDIRYYETEEQDAKKRLAVATAVLPGLRDSLRRLREDESGLDRDFAEAEEVISERLLDQQESRQEVKEEPTVRLFGKADQQVEQALRLKSPQSAIGLQEFLATHGRAFSRGAINYALRDLLRAGTIREVRREGNLRFFALVEGESA